jgi:hypothetical protein
MIDTGKYEGHTEGLWFNGEPTEISNAIYHGLIQLHPNELGKANARLAVDAPLLLAEVQRLHEIEQEWLMMWATLEELNIVADVRKNMTLHGFVFPTDEEMIE